MLHEPKATRRQIAISLHEDVRTHGRAKRFCLLHPFWFYEQPGPPVSVWQRDECNYTHKYTHTHADMKTPQLLAACGIGCGVYLYVYVCVYAYTSIFIIMLLCIHLFGTAHSGCRHVGSGFACGRVAVLCIYCITRYRFDKAIQSSHHHHDRALTCSPST